MKNENTKVVWVNVKNDVYESSLNELRKELDAGSLVHIYVDCIGHTRAAWVEEAYVSKLKSIYGDKFTTADHGGWEKAYCLKD